MKRPALALTLSLASAATIGACSLAFPASDLTGGAGGAGAFGTSGAGGAGGAGGPLGSSGAGGQGGAPPACASDAACDDGNPCTDDRCTPTGCVGYRVAPGTACGAGTECQAPPACSAAGTCVAAAKDDAKCDDGSSCTLDSCGAKGCHHAANTGAPCNDGDACHAAGTCNGQGHCAAAPIADTMACASTPCPGGFYASAFGCNPFCGECPYCVNSFSCTFACTPSVTACCGNDCAAACPPGYVPQGAPVKTPGCGCGAIAPGDTVTCVRAP